MLGGQRHCHWIVGTHHCRCVPWTLQNLVAAQALKEVFKEKWKTAFEHRVDCTEEGRGKKRKLGLASLTVERLRSKKPKLAFLADKRG